MLSDSHLETKRKVWGLCFDQHGWGIWVLSPSLDFCFASRTSQHICFGLVEALAYSLGRHARLICWTFGARLLFLSFFLLFFPPSFLLVLSPLWLLLTLPRRMLKLLVLLVSVGLAADLGMGADLMGSVLSESSHELHDDADAPSTPFIQEDGHEHEDDDEDDDGDDHNEGPFAESVDHAIDDLDGFFELSDAAKTADAIHKAALWQASLHDYELHHPDWHPAHRRRHHKQSVADYLWHLDHETE